MTQSAKWKLLGALLLCWLGLLAVRVMDDQEPRRQPLTYVSGQSVRADRDLESQTLVALLSAEPASLSGPQTPSKNIFAPLKFPKPKKKKRAVVKSPPLPAPKPVAASLPPRPSPEDLAAAQARKQMAQFRALGFSEEGGTPLAFLGKGNKIYIAQVGEELEDRIIVAAITGTAVRLRETRTRLETTLPLRPAAAAATP